MLFSDACGACHSLSGTDSPSRQGGDLLHLRVQRPELLEFVREMPLRVPLSSEAVSRVTDYVLAVQRAARSG